MGVILKKKKTGFFVLLSGYKSSLHSLDTNSLSDIL